MITQQKHKSKTRFVLKIILGFIIGISFGFGIGKMAKNNYKLSSSIEKVIQQNCDCESVTKDISKVGFQFTKEDGLTNQTASFILKNCKYEDSVKEEAKRINEFIKVAVDNYEAIDLLELSFNSEELLDLVKIKNGTIL